MNFEIVKLLTLVILKLIKSFKQQKKIDTQNWSSCCSLCFFVSCSSLGLAELELHALSWGIGFAVAGLQMQWCILATMGIRQGSAASLTPATPTDFDRESINEDEKRLCDRNPSGSYIFTSSIMNSSCLCSGTLTAPHDASPPCAVFSHSHR